MPVAHILTLTDGQSFLSRADGFDSVFVHKNAQSLFSILSTNPSGLCVVHVTPELNVADVIIQISDRFSFLPTLVVGDQLPLEAVRALSKLQTWDLLPSNATKADILGSLAGLSKSSVVTSEAHRSVVGECYAFVSSVGGAGASLMAVEAAYQIKRTNHHQSVCIIDLNLIDGAVAGYLNCDPGLNHTTFRKDAAAIDQVFLQSIVTPHEYGFDIIACPPWTPDRLQPSREFILHLLDITCERYDTIILDLPRWPSSWSKDVLKGCDAVILVSELTVPALNASRQWIQYFESDPTDTNGAPSKIKPVLNRQKKNMLGSRVSMEQAEAALRRSVFGFVRSDWAAAMAALNLGQAVGDAKPQSVIAKDVSQLIRQIRAEVQANRQTQFKQAS